MTEGKRLQQMELPQMKSIWIDEDQEMEKLYGFQVRQRFMNGPSTDSDEDADEDLGIVLVDSEKLALPNKNNIKLPPLPNYMTINPNINSNHKSLTNKKKNFLGMFKKRTCCRGDMGLPKPQNSQVYLHHLIFTIFRMLMVKGKTTLLSRTKKNMM